MRALSTLAVSVVSLILSQPVHAEDAPTVVVLPDGIRIEAATHAVQTVTRIAAPVGALDTHGVTAKAQSGRVADGHYRYELDMLPETRSRTAAEFEADQYAQAPVAGKRISGGFTVVNGELVEASRPEQQPETGPSPTERRRNAGVRK